MQTYSYKPLRTQDETRILVLEPGNYNDPLIGSIVHIDLTDAPDYDAVSYCWENSKENSLSHLHADAIIGIKDVPPSTDIHIKEKMRFHSRVRLRDMAVHPDDDIREMYFANGGPRPPGLLNCDGQTMSIGGELYSALKRFRNADTRRNLWADAICIHQTDLHEKASQISNMGRIFSTAQTVLIWLGESWMNLEESYPALVRIGEMLEELCSWPHDTPIQFLAPFLIRWGSRNDINWDHLAELLRRKWFKRIWCLQEVVKARNAIIQMSFMYIPWEDFAFIVGTLRDAGLDDPLQARGEPLGTEAVSVMWNTQRSQTRPAILDLLHRTRQRESTLASDKVFAILGLVSEEERKDIQIDYHIPPESVFRNLAINHIVKNNSLEILYHCCKSCTTSNLHLPSWVPDWTQPAWHEPLVSTSLEPHAALDTEPEFSFSEEDGIDTLLVRGRIIDEIVSIGNERVIPRKSIAASYSTRVDKRGERRTTGTSPDQDPNDPSDQLGERRKDSLPPSNDLFSTYMRMAHLRKWLKKFHHTINLPNEESEYNDNSNLQPSSLFGDHPQNKTNTNTNMEEITDVLHASIVTQVLSQQPGFIHESSKPRNLDKANPKVKQDDDLYELTALYSAGSPFFHNTETSNIGAGDWCHDRKLFRSSRYNYGWCPEGVEAGDKIAVVNGLDVPLVLREVEHGFEVCGDCFLFRAMDGEVMKEDYDSRMLRLV